MQGLNGVSWSMRPISAGADGLNNWQRGKAAAGNG